MLTFLKERSYDIIAKMLVTQIAIAVFGIALAIATGSKSTSENPEIVQPATMQIVTSTAAIAFYLFLIFIALWEIGAKDAGKFQRGEPGVSRLTGFYMALVASLPNFLVAICVTLGTFLSDISFFSSLGGIAATIGLLIEGMYTGLLAIRIGGTPLNSMWFMWFVIMLPMILTATLGYIAGLYEIRLFKPNSTKNMRV